MTAFLGLVWGRSGLIIIIADCGWGGTFDYAHEQRGRFEGVEG